MLYEAQYHMDKAKHILKIAFGNDMTEATKKLTYLDDYINGRQSLFREIKGANSIEINIPT